MSSTIRPFKIDVPQAAIDALHTRLALTTYPDELSNAGWSYGAPLADVKFLAEKWLKEYDWRKHEKELNDSLPQFMTDIEVDGFGSMEVHFVYEKSGKKKAIPLLFIHGWPGSFHEVSKILPLLTSPTDEAHPSFDVVAFSLPGFGFSEAPKKPGFALKQYAELGHKLMLKLGYNEYVVQGGDWGSAIGAVIARTYGPKHCKALHRNLLPCLPPSFFSHPLLWLENKLTPLSPFEASNLQRGAWFFRDGLGYFQLQQTQPQTLGYGLADSPVGLLGWLYEKIHNWTDDCPFTDDELLTWVSIYAFSRPGPAASVRIYYENNHEQRRLGSNNPNASFYTPIQNGVPMGCSIFPKEMGNGRKIWRKAHGNIVFDKEHDKGGHFAALERPDDLAGDLREMFAGGGEKFGLKF